MVFYHGVVVVGARAAAARTTVLPGDRVIPSPSTFDIDEAFGKTMAEQLREALSKAAVRVVDLFREWGAPRCSGPRP